MPNSTSLSYTSWLAGCAALALVATVPMSAGATETGQPANGITASAAALLAQSSSSDSVSKEKGKDETAKSPGDGLNPVTVSPQGTPTTQLPAQAIKPTPDTVPTSSNATQ